MCTNKDPPYRYKHVVKYDNGEQEEIKLGVWCAITQREAKKGQGNYAITKKQIKQLSKIGFQWNPKKGRSVHKK